MRSCDVSSVEIGGGAVEWSAERAYALVWGDGEPIAKIEKAIEEGGGSLPVEKLDHMSGEELGDVVKVVEKGAADARREAEEMAQRVVAELAAEEEAKRGTLRSNQNSNPRPPPPLALSARSLRPADVLHHGNIYEDMAIAHGYNNIVKTIPKTLTVAKQLPINKLTDQLRESTAQAGFTEVCWFC